jgi:exodeoxyribonuclease V alpha subunit
MGMGGAMASKKNSKKSSAGDMPKMSRVDLERALASGALEGFTPGVAKKLVALFGADAAEAVARWEPQAKQLLGAAWDKANGEVIEHGEALGMLAWLTARGFSGTMARKAMIWQRHESEWGSPKMALDAWALDPHALSLIPGITFERADRIALSDGMEAGSQARLMACAKEALRVGCDNAGGGASQPEIESHARKLLGLNGALPPRECHGLAPKALEAALAKGLAKATQDEHGRPLLFSADLYEAEERSAHLLLAMVGEPSPLGMGDLEARIQRAEALSGLSLHEEQREALATLFKGRVCVVGGKPGSGKTTLLKCAAPLLEEGGRVVFYAAPTGKAAKRMGKSLGRQATTIHRLLGQNGGGGRGGQAKWEDDEGGRPSLKKADAVVIDESSMLDSRMLLRLLSAVGPQTALIFLGDPQQLPSVGAGKVLSDLIESGRVPTTIMSKIMRQKDGSSITSVARAIGEGRWIDFTDREGDCLFLESPKPAEIAERIARMLLVGAKGKYDPLRDVQILAAGNHGDAGVKTLNLRLQALLNPPKPGQGELEIREDFILRVGDKVMQTANDYERLLTPLPLSQALDPALPEASPFDDEPARLPKERFVAVDDFAAGPPPMEIKGVFNGDVGYVESVSAYPRPGKVRVRFEDGVAEYDVKEASGSLALAFACTVHKFQGSEAPLIFFVMPEGTPQMLCTRNLVYTALTRATRKCLVLGSERVLKRAIERDALQGRNTRLRGLLDGSLTVDKTASPQALALSEKQGLARMALNMAGDLLASQGEAAFGDDSGTPPQGEPVQAKAPRKRAKSL